ncbi:MAG: DUF547 domain-containing protein [Pseudomonadota bacterium]
MLVVRALSIRFRSFNLANSAGLAIAAGLLSAAPAKADTAESAATLPSAKVTVDAAVEARATSIVSDEGKVFVPGRELSQFRPAAAADDHTIDYSYFDEALEWFVVPMGPSIRETPRRAEPRTGTRRIYGHESRYRLEGNRVAFSYFDNDIRASLTEYREDLERVGSDLDLTRLPRNEQLAFWLNLHNVAVIEALAYEYPLAQPSQRTFGSNEAMLDNAKLVIVAGVELSPRDIRERIVYPNWSDPRVIYGFWRGEIGGPTLQRVAFSGDNVSQMLGFSAEEFVNSLRGVENTGKTLRVSQIYEEASPFYFEDDAALRSHLNGFARDEVKEVIAKTDRTIINDYEKDVADLSRGERDPALWNLLVTDSVGPFAITTAQRTRPNPVIQRLMEERSEKLRRAVRRGIRTGNVIIGQEGLEAKEVE